VTGMCSSLKEEFSQCIKEQISRMNDGVKELDGVGKKFSNLLDKLAEASQNMDTTDALEQQLPNLTLAVTQVQTLVNALELQVKQRAESQHGLEQVVHDINEKLTSVTQKLATLADRDGVKTDTEILPSFLHGIQKHYQLLSQKVFADKLVPSMFAENKLTFEELQWLQSNNYSTKDLLNIILSKKSEEVYNCFLERLKMTKQDEAYMLLTQEDYHVDSSHAAVIQKHFNTLPSMLDSDNGLLAELYSKLVLDDTDMSVLNSFTSQTERNQKLLIMMSQMSPTNFQQFCDALYKTCQAHVADILTQ
jgi:tetrahydromethanopterin S-methyltransferase subunit B